MFVFLPKVAFIPSFSNQDFLYRYFSTSLIINNKSPPTCILSPHAGSAALLPLFCAVLKTAHSFPKKCISKIRPNGCKFEIRRGRYRCKHGIAGYSPYIRSSVRRMQKLPGKVKIHSEQFSKSIPNFFAVLFRTFLPSRFLKPRMVL